jgi:cGMP-specific 3',5'-cyclic phosphodiesterase
MFTMLYTGELRPKFDAVEVFALMTACLCHDLDHRGTNNAFQVKVASPLAMLYSTSVLEHHHFDHCIMIINSEGNNIFQSFTPEEYRRAIKILEHAILSTDLALYFKKRGEFKALVESGEKNFQEDDKKDLLKAMMMTACDVAAITKPWRIQKEIAQLVTSEFFEQGDIEKTQLGEKPIPMMDREKKDELPKMQVDFIDFICTPVYELFAKISEPLKILNDGCANNRRHWQELDELHKQGKKWINEETREIGERSQEKQAGDKWDEQGLNKTKQDVSVNSHQVNNSSVKTDTNLLNSQKKDSNLTIICDHNSKIQERNRTAISNVNVISVNVESKTPPNSSSPAIEDVDVKDQGKSHNVKPGVSKKSSKSSKSHFCLLS